MSMRDDVERVLREHRWKPTDDLFACACGQVPGSSLGMETHRADRVMAVVAQHGNQAVIDALASGRILHLQPDDVVAVHLAQAFSQEQAVHVAKTVKGVVGDRQVLLVAAGCEVDGYRPVGG